MSESKNNLLAIDPAEFSVAKEAAKDSTDTYTHTFRKPFTCFDLETKKDKEYTTLAFDFGKLTGKELLDIENELQLLGKTVIAPTFSGEFLCRMAARAAGISADAMLCMPAADFNKIRGRARSFLLKTES